jgi:CRP-like cAMP-binding protein
VEDLLTAPDSERTPDDGKQVRTAPEDVAVTMTNVMMDSMRNTYGILARRMDLFRRISPENVARVFAKGRTEEFSEGDCIFTKGSHGDTMYVILSGAVAIVDGDRILATMEQGEMFGEMALVTQSARTADARAVSDVAVLSLTMDDIMNTFGGEVSCQILVNIIIALSHRLRKANAQ